MKGDLNAKPVFIAGDFNVSTGWFSFGPYHTQTHSYHF